MRRTLMVGFLVTVFLAYNISECFSKTVGIVYLTDGKNIEGTIIGMTPDQQLILKTKAGKEYHISIKFIERVEVFEITEDEKPKTAVIVYKQNGEVLRGTIIEMKPGGSLKLETSEGELYEFPSNSIDKVELEITSKKLEIPVKEREISIGPRKSPGLALALSIYVPGAGQFYNGDMLKGAIIFPVVIVGGICSWAVLASTWGNSDEETDYRLVLGALAGSATYIYSIIDAYSSAARKNRERGYSLYEFPLKDNLILSVTPVSNRSQEFEPGLRLTYSF